METPILLIIFNRPDTTQRIFDIIRVVKPKYLFIAADGPRPDNPTDIEACRAARAIIEQVDWPCTVRTLFRTENRGCGQGPAEAITWFFDHVEEGIILEDDCLPTEDFFDFCTKMLTYYRGSPNISVISGTNLMLKWKSTRQPYLFCLTGPTWGWATWKRAWQYFDYNLTEWGNESNRDIVKKLLREVEYKYWGTIFDELYKCRRTDVWDYQWYLARLINCPISIVPSVNLVSNIGYGKGATHTIYKSAIIEMPIFSYRYDLFFRDIELDKLFDRVVFERFYNPNKKTLLRRVLIKFSRVVLAK
ncbi:nucleotide-diphospho-sugar transferase [Larkinella bovis]|uniref:Nucleotide-diphospho-sugar transferase n=1 Tax=Larkinella bovis TaxID=683041 RepID=A0ABW0IKQ7_9BACT